MVLTFPNKRICILIKYFVTASVYLLTIAFTLFPVAVNVVSIAGVSVFDHMFVIFQCIISEHRPRD